MKAVVPAKAKAWIGPAVAAAFTLLAAGMQPFRGLNLWSLWVVDAAERMHGWRTTGGEHALRAAFDDPNGVPPLLAYTASVLGGGDGLLGARLATMAAAAVVAWIVHVWSRELAGERAAWAATLALWLQPRFWGAVTVPAPTLFAVAGVLVLWRVTLRARDDGRWFAPAAVLGALGLATGLPAWTALAPLAWLVLVDAGSVTRGQVRIRRVGAWTLALPLLWCALLVAVIPWLHQDTGERLGMMIGLWVERPAEPFLVAGRWWGAIRMWPWTPLQWLALTTPAALLCGVVAFAGTFVSERDRRQEYVAFVIWAFCLPVVVRSVFHGGIDVMLFPAVALAVGFGQICASLTGVGRVRWLPVGLCAVVVLVSAVDVARAGGVWEGYRTGVVGGAPGAAAGGTSRFPHGPIAPEPLVAATERGARRFAVLANEWEIRPVFDRYRVMGLLPEDAQLTGLAEADAVVLSLDDALPEFYSVVSDWSMFERGAPDAVLAVRVQGVPVFAVGLIR